MAQALIVDGRNFLDPIAMREAGFDYEGIGRSSAGQADQGRRERGVLGTRATEDAEMRRSGKLRTSRSGFGRSR
jgi:hypothetical protein